MGPTLSLKDYPGTLKVTQSVGTPGRSILDSADQLLLILPDKIPATAWQRIPQGKRLRELMRRRVKGSVPAVSSRLANKRQTAVHVGTTSASATAFEILTFARKLVAAALREKAGAVSIWVTGFGDQDQARLIRACVAAALAAAFQMPEFKSKTSPARIRSVRVVGSKERLDLERVIAEADGNNLARWLTAQPANKLDAVSYAAILKELSKSNGWQMKQYSVAQLRKMGAGAFLAVAQGNADDSATIVRLGYRPGSKSAEPALSLVGKGIIFDTGGTNLKPFTSMLSMHIDMGGSAVAVGSLLALTRLGAEFPADCWLAITENRTGPTAYKSQDVVQAANGKTIQTIHTDAEGRMALADTLVFASRDKPKFLIDFATLTGTCVNAVTTRFSGVFTNRTELHPILRKTGEQCGERVWPFPIGKEYLEDLKSQTADYMQCSPNSAGDHILAASFLNEFVEKDVPWVHMDLAACTHKGGLAQVPSEITGFGVRYTLQLLLDQNILDHEFHN
ncbi:MAG: leucyl aminopeptidase family protein [Gammaproteobacteria bacterium]|nr:leucyl aminopeptidase family protein [Gammaproteobacteria bacterium]